MASAGRIVRGPEIASDATLSPDFCVVGSGAGGSVAAATLSAAGAKVVILEEGGYHDRREFNMQEAWAYPTLYQDHGSRATEDLAITILQGRAVGGGTTVNWTSSFRTPEKTLRLWRERYGIEGIEGQALAPHFEAVEKRLNIGEGSADDVNRNNQKLWDGARRLGLRPQRIPRNVKGCARLGYCGLGCPLDAKQSALVTYVPDAIASGAELYTNCRAVSLEAKAGRVIAVVAQVLDEGPDRPSGRTLTVRPRRGVLLAGGAINTPALLLRSRVGTHSGLVGRRTFLHPTVPVVGMFPEPIEAYYGAPQSVACHDFADRGARVGYFIETAPVHPMLAAIAFPGFGDPHRRLAERLPFVQATIALLIDGHHEDPGGHARVSGSGHVKLAYALGEPLREAAVDAEKTMARLVLAAGAVEVITLHDPPLVIRREADVAAIERAPWGPNRHTFFSAHQMGGCPMGRDPERSVVDGRGRHHEIENLWVTDGSVFPTSLGVNPQLSIYAVSRLFAQEISRMG